MEKIEVADPEAMILLDTNVAIYAMQGKDCLHRDWARELISRAVARNGAGLNAISLSEIHVGATRAGEVNNCLRQWGITFLDVPYLASREAARAYNLYRLKTPKNIPSVPLPDFFIGAHALIMGWRLGTADHGRFCTYFPEVHLIMPETIPTED